VGRGAAVNLVVPPIRNQDQETPERARVGPYYLCWEKDEHGTACDMRAGHYGDHTWQLRAERGTAMSDVQKPVLTELETRFTYHPPQSWQIPFYEEMRVRGFTLAEWIDQRLPDCREKSLALTSIEQAIMWANAGMARRGTKPEEDHP
jgi:hypothetical protein